MGALLEFSMSSSAQAQKEAHIYAAPLYPPSNSACLIRAMVEQGNRGQSGGTYSCS